MDWPALPPGVVDAEGSGDSGCDDVGVGDETVGDGVCGAGSGLACRLCGRQSVSVDDHECQSAGA